MWGFLGVTPRSEGRWGALAARSGRCGDVAPSILRPPLRIVAADANSSPAVDHRETQTMSEAHFHLPKSRTTRASRFAVLSFAIFGLTILVLARPALAQRPGVNEDETKVPAYTLPDPLALADGGRVADAATWNSRRRPEILRLFETQMYGPRPARPRV